MCSQSISSLGASFPRTVTFLKQMWASDARLQLHFLPSSPYLLWRSNTVFLLLHQTIAFAAIQFHLVNCIWMSMMANLPPISKKILLLFMKQMQYGNIKISPDLMQEIVRSCKGRAFSGYTMHHPNGPALSINYDFDSLSKSGLRGEEKGHLRHERKVGILRFVPRELLL